MTDRNHTQTHDIETVFDTLSDGDDVYVNDRDNALTVDRVDDNPDEVPIAGGNNFKGATRVVYLTRDRHTYVLVKEILGDIHLRRQKKVAFTKSSTPVETLTRASP